MTTGANRQARKRRRFICANFTPKNDTLAEHDTSLISPTPPPVPVFPQQLTDPKLSLDEKIWRIQSFINAFQYNYTGKSFFKKDMRRDRGINHITNIAKDIMRQALPIQCVEALFLGIHLTNTMKNELIRIPITFESISSNEWHSHIVLGLKALKGRGGTRKDERWGALGISRIPSLMYKELKFEKLASLLKNYQHAYNDSGHVLERISLGTPFPCEAYAGDRPKWRTSVIEMSEVDKQNLCDVVSETHAEECQRAYNHYLKHGHFPPWRIA